MVTRATYRTACSFYVLFGGFIRNGTRIKLQRWIQAVHHLKMISWPTANGVYMCIHDTVSIQRFLSRSPMMSMVVVVIYELMFNIRQPWTTTNSTVTGAPLRLYSKSRYRHHYMQLYPKENWTSRNRPFLLNGFVSSVTIFASPQWASEQKYHVSCHSNYLQEYP